MATTTGVDIVVKVLGDNNIRKLDTQLKGLDKTSQATGKNVSVASKGAKGLGTAAGGAVPSVQGLGAALSSALGPLLAVSTAVAAVGKAIGTAFERDVAEKRLENLTKSTGEYEAALAYAQVAANKFKTTQTESTKAIGDAYSRLNGLGFGLKEVTTVYDGFNTIAREAGVSTEDASGAFLQLSQAMGSGVLQGDELRSILERMPQLAVAIAKEMGVSATQIKSLGAEGKITSEVLYNTFANMGEGVTDFGSKMTDAQRGMADFRAAAENAFNAFGEMITPVIAPALEFVTGLVQGLADWWGYLADEIFPKVKEAFQPVIDALSRLFEGFDWNALGTFFANTADVIINELLWGFKQLVPVIVGVIDLIKAAFNTPLVQGFVTVLGSVADALGLTGDKVGDWKKEQEAATKAAADSVDQYSKLPPKLISAKDEAKKLKQEHKEITAELKNQLGAIDRIAKAQGDALDNEYQLTESLRELRKTINDGEIASLKVKQDKSKSLKDQIYYENQIYQLTKDNIELEYQGAIAAIEQQRTQQQLELAKLAARKAAVEMAVAEATALGTVTTEMRNQLTVAQQIYDDRLNQSQAIDKIFSVQKGIAGELKSQQLAQAKLAKDGAIKALNEQATKTAAEGAADAMERQVRASAQVAENASAAAAAMSGVSSGMVRGLPDRYNPWGELSNQERDNAKIFADIKMGWTRKVDGEDIFGIGPDELVHLSSTRLMDQALNEHVKIANEFSKDMAEGVYEGVTKYVGSGFAFVNGEFKAMDYQEFKELQKQMSEEAKNVDDVLSRTVSTRAEAVGIAEQELAVEKMLAAEAERRLAAQQDMRDVQRAAQQEAAAAKGAEQKQKVPYGGDDQYFHSLNKAHKSNQASGGAGLAGMIIQYHGSTLNFDGQDFIKKDDVQTLLDKAQQQIMLSQHRNPVYRLTGAY